MRTLLVIVFICVNVVVVNRSEETRVGMVELRVVFVHFIKQVANSDNR